MHLRYAIVLTALFLSGCKLTYTITMRPEGEGFARSIQCLELRTQKGPDGKDKLVKDPKFPASQTPKLDKLYGAKAEGDPPTYRGVFQKKTPQDVGGAGSWVRWHGSLGTMTVYVERFGGDIDLHQDMAKSNQAIDHGVRTLTEWFKSELGDDPRWPTLEKFLTGPFRKDLKDIAVLLWLSRSMDQMEEEMGVRVVHQLIERGYTTAEKWPMDMAALQNDRGMALVQRLVAQRMGVAGGGPLPEGLKFLSSQDAAEASMQKWYKGTEAYKKKHAEWRKNKADNPDLAEPQQPDIDLTPLMGRGFFAKPHHVVLNLQTPEKPYATNGQWNATTQTTTWQRRYDGEHRLPTLVYATWSVPNEPAQKKMFGRVILDSKPLGNYLMQLQGMSPPDRQRFEAFLAGLAPNDDLPQLIGDFKNAEGKKPPVVQTVLDALKNAR